MPTKNSAGKRPARAYGRESGPTNLARSDAVELFGGQTMLPVQFFARGARESDSVTRLMVAVLQDAVRTCLRCAGRRDRQSLGQLREVLYWLEREDIQGVFSFENICQMLEIDARAMRHKLYEICGINPGARQKGFRAHRGGGVRCERIAM